MIERTASSICSHSGEAEDTAQHILEKCPAWVSEGARLVAAVGLDLMLDTIIRVAMSDPEWKVSLFTAVRSL